MLTRVAGFGLKVNRLFLARPNESNGKSRIVLVLCPLGKMGRPSAEQHSQFSTLFL